MPNSWRSIRSLADIYGMFLDCSSSAMLWFMFYVLVTHAAFASGPGRISWTEDEVASGRFKVIFYSNKVAQYCCQGRTIFCFVHALLELRLRWPGPCVLTCQRKGSKLIVLESEAGRPTSNDLAKNYTWLQPICKASPTKASMSLISKKNAWNVATEFDFEHACCSPCRFQARIS